MVARAVNITRSLDGAVVKTQLALHTHPRPRTLICSDVCCTRARTLARSHGRKIRCVECWRKCEGFVQKWSEWWKGRRTTSCHDHVCVCVCMLVCVCVCVCKPKATTSQQLYFVQRTAPNHSQHRLPGSTIHPSIHPSNHPSIHWSDSAPLWSRTRTRVLPFPRRALCCSLCRRRLFVAQQPGGWWLAVRCVVHGPTTNAVVEPPFGANAG